MSVIERERVEAPVVTEADVLNRAADLLEEFGWLQLKMCPEGWNALGRTQGPFCLVGAITRARLDFGGDMFNDGVGVSLTEQAAKLVDPDSDGHPDFWNDSPDRTKEEVISALREAAARA